MNDTRRRTWHTGLIATLAALYAWAGLAAHGIDQVLGLTGALLILTALALMTRSRITAGVLLVSGALPLAIHTWWSLITPLLAVLVITLGWFALNARTHPTTTQTSPASPSAAVGRGTGTQASRCE